MWNLLAQSTSSEDAAAAAAAAGVMGGMMIFYIIFIVGMYVTQALALMTISRKTGIGTDKAWFAWVPILNIVLALEIAGLELWMIVLMLIPCVNIGLMVYMWMKIAEKRGRPSWWGVLMLVPCVSFFVPLYLAYTDA